MVNMDIVFYWIFFGKNPNKKKWSVFFKKKSKKNSPSLGIFFSSAQEVAASAQEVARAGSAGVSDEPSLVWNSLPITH